MNIITVGKNGKASIRAIQEQMVQPIDVFARFTKRNSGEQYWQCNWSGHLDTCPTISQDAKVIRWGHYMDIPVRHNIVYNHAKAIRKASNKAQSRKMIQAANIPTPRTFFAPFIELSNLPLIGRTKHHYKGSGFFLCNTVEDVQHAIEQQAIYFSALYPKTKEIRVHCAHGRVLVCSEKHPTNIQEASTMWGNADVEHLYWSEFDPFVCKIALDACKLLGLDYGAVDVLAYPTNNNLPRAVVCEVNTSPELTPYIVKKYAKYFDWLFDSTERRPHENYSQFVHGSDYAWPWRV